MTLKSDPRSLRIAFILSILLVLTFQITAVGKKRQQQNPSALQREQKNQRKYRPEIADQTDERCFRPRLSTRFQIQGNCQTFAQRAQTAAQPKRPRASKQFKSALAPPWSAIVQTRTARRSATQWLPTPSRNSRRPSPRRSSTSRSDCSSTRIRKSDA